MLDLIVIFLSLAVFPVALAVFANRFRQTHAMDFELKPNCLLTRWPIIFVTGPRSLFYFSHYWNLYTVFLAEHGYEVFTVHLPWKDPLRRRERFELFLRHQAETHKNFHVFLDSPTLKEFESILTQASRLSSITEIADKDVKGDEHNHGLSPRFNVPYHLIEFEKTTQPGFILRLSYFLHRLSLGLRKVPSLNTLGAVPYTAINNSLVLLERAQTLAETDLRREA